MTTPAAVSGTFSDLKMVKTRSVVQMVIEVPIERAGEVTDAFGWPQPGSEIHVAVARLKLGDAQQEKPKRPPAQTRSELARRMCGVKEFQDFIVQKFTASTGMRSDNTSAQSYSYASLILKDALSIKSKSELDPPDGNADWAPAKAWDQLYADFQQATGRIAEAR